MAQRIKKVHVVPHPLLRKIVKRLTPLHELIVNVTKEDWAQDQTLACNLTLQDFNEVYEGPPIPHDVKTRTAVDRQVLRLIRKTGLRGHLKELDKKTTGLRGAEVKRTTLTFEVNFECSFNGRFTHKFHLHRDHEPCSCWKCRFRQTERHASFDTLTHDPKEWFDVPWHCNNEIWPSPAEAKVRGIHK